MSEQFDAETLALMRSYAGHDFDKPRLVQREAFCQWGSETWTLREFIEAVEAAKEKIPADCLDDAKVQFEAGDYDTSGKLEILYWDAESQADVSARVARALRYASEKRQGERLAYERLKAKFEGAGATPNSPLSVKGHRDS